MTLRWDTITSGETFQSFAAQLVLHVDPGARAFTWPGPDAGQDALSGDGRTVYQAKHHARPEARHPRQDALQELAKIRRYREPTHERYARWAPVRGWILVTNVATQASEARRWEAEVVPAFAAEGLEVELWGAERLEQLVGEFPALKRAFFDGETRAFISLGEALRYAWASDAAALGGDLPTLRGREALVAEIVARLGTNRIVSLIAPAGVGSSRVAMAAATLAVTSDIVPAAYFANPANLAADTRWYEGFVPEHPMLVVLDELDDDDGVLIVKRIVEEMKTRAATWKLLVTTKTHQQHIRTALLGGDMGESIEVRPLAEDATIALVEEIVRSRIPADSILKPQLSRVARAIAVHSAGFPTWAALSALTLASGGDLSWVPASRREQVHAFLHGVSQRLPLETAAAEAVVPALRAIAALGTLDLHQHGSCAWVRETAGGISSEQLLRILEALERVGVMRRRGVNRRLWSVTPAVLADAVLTEWLTEDAPGRRGASNATALSLATWLREAISKGETAESPVVPVLRTLARVGFVGAEQGRPISDAISLLFRDVRARAGEAQELERVIDLAEEIAHWMPGIAVDLALHVLRLRVGGDSGEEPGDGMRRARERVPWLLFHAAHGARTADERREVVSALSRAALCEATGLPPTTEQDGKSAARVIRRVLESIDEVAGDFTREFETAITAILASPTPDAASIQVAEWFIEPLVHAEGVTTRYEFDTFCMRHYRVHPESERAKARWRMLDRFWGILEHEPRSPWRLLAWRMLLASRSTNMFGSDDLRDRSSTHMERAVQILDRHPETSLDELREARRTWSWHLEYDNDADAKALAEQCESHYVRAVRSDPATNILLGRDFDAELEPVRTGTAIEVAHLFSTALVAAERLDDDFAWARLRMVADTAGRSGRPECREAWFVLVQKADTGARRTSVMIEYLAGLLVAARRTSGPAIFDLWRDVDVRAPALALRARAALYGDRGTLASAFLAEDLASFGERVCDLAASYPIETFCALGRMVRLGPAAMRLVAEAWPSTAAARRTASFRALAEGAYSAITADTTVQVPALSTWLLDQLVEVPDPDHVFAGAGDWYLEQVLAKCGKPKVAWVTSFLVERAARHERLGYSYDAVPSSTPLHQFVDATVPDAAALAEIFRLVAREVVVPKWLAALDPSRRTLIDLMASGIEAARGEPGELARAARWASCFVENSDEWRRLAVRAAAHATAFPSDDRRRVYRQLTDQCRVYVSKAGEIAPARLQELSRAQTRLGEEQDVGLLDYWRWRVADAAESVEYERQALEEERW